MKKFDDVGLEALLVNEQSKSKVEALIDCVSELKSEIAIKRVPNSEKGLKEIVEYQKRIADVLRELFNINVRVDFVLNYYNFAVLPMQLEKTSVIRIGEARTQIDLIEHKNEEGDTHLKTVKDILEKNTKVLRKNPGTIDFKEAKVSGGYSEVENLLLLDPLGTFPILTSEEITAMILHEVGHVFLAFSTVHRTRGVMAVLNEIMLDQFKTEPSKRLESLKVRLSDAKSSGELPEKAVDAYLNTDPKDAMAFTLSISKLMMDSSIKDGEDMGSESKFVRLHRLSNEQSADVFVSKMGYGYDMVRALDKLHSWVYGKGHKEAPQDLFEVNTNAMAINITTIISSNIMLYGLIGGAIMLSGGGAGVSLFFTAQAVGLTGVAFARLLEVLGKDRSSRMRVYDTGIERIDSILNAEIKRLTTLHKQSHSKKEIKRLIKNVEYVQKMVENANRSRSTYQALADFFLTSSSDQRQLEMLRADMESLANNKLYVASIKLLT